MPEGGNVSPSTAFNHRSRDVTKYLVVFLRPLLYPGAKTASIVLEKATKTWRGVIRYNTWSAAAATMQRKPLCWAQAKRIIQARDHFFPSPISSTPVPYLPSDCTGWTGHCASPALAISGRQQSIADLTLAIVTAKSKRTLTR